MTIPLSGDFRTELGPEKAIALELTKEVQPYRVYPDPFFFSEHAAGLPSSVRVLAVTLHRPDVKVAFDPDEPANAFTEGQEISYTATLENTTAAHWMVSASTAFFPPSTMLTSEEEEAKTTWYSFICRVNLLEVLM